jgi:hypothetical protein
MKPAPQFEKEFIAHELEIWGDYVEQKMREALNSLDVGYSDELLRSLSHTVVAANANHKGRYEQRFMEYGRFVDMGAGRGLQTEANKQRALRRKKAKGRKPKKWYSKTFYGSLNKLIGALSRNYAQFAMQQIRAMEAQVNSSQNAI